MGYQSDIKKGNLVAVLNERGLTEYYRRSKKGKWFRGSLTDRKLQLNQLNQNQLQEKIKLTRKIIELKKEIRRFNAFSLFRLWNTSWKANKGVKLIQRLKIIYYTTKLVLKTNR